MSNGSRSRAILTGSLLLMLMWWPAALGAPTIGGLAAAKLEPRLKGLILIEELNCVACHASGGSLGQRSKSSPLLSDVGSHLNPSHIEAFIRDPHGIKPGTTMPDVLSQLGEEEKKQVAKLLTHFLLSLKANDFSPQAPDTVAAGHGKGLFHSKGCVACHSPRDEKGAELLPAQSVPLGALDKKYSLKSMVAFLRRPHTTRPSGRMPDMQLHPQEIERIAHYLLRDTRVPGALDYTLYRGQVWEGLESDMVRAERAGRARDFSLAALGPIQQHTAIKFEGWMNLAKQGKYTFFLTMNGGTLQIDGKQVLTQEPSDRRGVKQLEGAAELASGWRQIQLTYFHTGREPRFSFEMQGPDFPRQAIPTSMLSVSNEPIPAYEPLKVDASLAARGRREFEQRGCANCHVDLRVPARPATGFARLQAGVGCLSGTPGAWPRFDLNVEQRELIARAMPEAEQPKLDDKQQINKTLATFNCIGCHDRAGVGGVAPERDEYFTGTNEALGNQGRLAPPLTHVGAKLKPEWIADVLLNARRQRDYLHASMPQYGQAHVGHLVDLFGKVDELEAANIPKVADPKELKKAGWQLIGTDGMSCISCHDFNGQRSGAVGALDLIRVTERLKKNWYHLYMRQPSRFHPSVIMPSYWPDGVSARPEILGGDAAQQIEAMWLYLEDGGRVKRPTGLARTATELRVGDVTEICRGHSTAGFRAMGVGYPERISLAFDTEEMALRQLWKGEFVNVDIGSFRPRGTELITFPRGIPFYRLKSMEEDWPYKSKTNHAFPQDHGYQFRGYHLDAQRRPALLYQFEEISVRDFFEDLRDKNDKPYFKRTITFEAPADQAPFYFRAACGAKVSASSDRSFSADQLQIRITSDQKGVVREGKPGEVLITVQVPKGKSTLTLEYQW